MKFLQFNASTGEDSTYNNHKIAEFLYEHLEQYGDKLDDIKKCTDYVMNPDKGGNILVGIDNDEIVGAVILNNTGMKDYIPENILVYIAVDGKQRGKGYGKKMMEKAISVTNGSIALHVEPDNPAFHLYTKMGFTNKYLEMRLAK